VTGGRYDATNNPEETMRHAISTTLVLTAGLVILSAGCSSSNSAPAPSNVPPKPAKAEVESGKTGGSVGVNKTKVLD